jgi:outer membrane protein insertion porin family
LRMGFMRNLLRVTLFFYWGAGVVIAQQGTLAGLAIKEENLIFVGNKSISSQELKAIFRNAGTVTAGLSPDKIDLYTADRMNHSLNMILAFYHNRGFIKAAVTPPEVDFAPGAESKLQLIFKVSENHAYNLGQVKISGAENLGQPLLVSLLNLQPKMPINLSKITSGASAVQELYLTLGYLDVDIKTRLDPVDDKKTADLIIGINEGKQYHLGKVELVGNSPIKSSLIREFLPFQSGDIFGKKAFDSCLQNLNELGTTSMLTSADVNFSYDRQQALVDVVINLEGKHKE